MYICHHCIDDPIIKSRIMKDGKTHNCDFCKKRARALSVDDVSEIVDAAFREHYVHGDDMPVFDMDDESDRVYYEQQGEYLDEILSDILICETEVANAIASSLAENEDCLPQDGDICFYSDDVKYVFTEEYDYVFGESWSGFRNIVKHKQRFFLDNVISILDNIFSNIHVQKTRSGQVPIVKIKPSDDLGTFYRARTAITDKELAQILLNAPIELGSPPPHKSTAGRMNPAGIPVFYGAYDRETCIVELRPPVGASVVTGEFKLCKDVTVLDLTVFDNPMMRPSVFDIDSKLIVQHYIFMNGLHDEISSPILPSDEPISYVPTQVIAEYLSSRYNIDGVIFRSSQSSSKSKNIVLFNQSSMCKGNALYTNFKVTKRHSYYDIVKRKDSDKYSTTFRSVLAPGYDHDKCGVAFVEKSAKIHSVRSYRPVCEDVDFDISDEDRKVSDASSHPSIALADLWSQKKG